MGLIDAIFLGIAGTIALNRENKRIEKLNEKRKAWLDQHGYNIAKQLELERWCRDNIEVVIEEVYEYPYRSLPWERTYKSFRAGNVATQVDIYKTICKRNGISYFDFRFPPEGYKNVS